MTCFLPTSNLEEKITILYLKHLSQRWQIDGKDETGVPYISEEPIIFCKKAPHSLFSDQTQHSTQRSRKRNIIEADKTINNIWL